MITTKSIRPASIHLDLLFIITISIRLSIRFWNLGLRTEEIGILVERMLKGFNPLFKFRVF